MLVVDKVVFGPGGVLYKQYIKAGDTLVASKVLNKSINLIANMEVQWNCLLAQFVQTKDRQAQITLTISESQEFMARDKIPLIDQCFCY